MAGGDKNRGEISLKAVPMRMVVSTDPALKVGRNPAGRLLYPAKLPPRPLSEAKDEIIQFSQIGSQTAFPENITRWKVKAEHVTLRT